MEDLLSRFTELQSENLVSDYIDAYVNAEAVVLIREQIMASTQGRQIVGMLISAHPLFILNCNPDANMPQIPGRCQVKTFSASQILYFNCFGVLLMYFRIYFKICRSIVKSKVGQHRNILCSSLWEAWKQQI